MLHFGGRAQIAHNLYSEVLIEIGVVGLLLYLRVLASILQNVRAVGPAVKETRRTGDRSDDDSFQRTLRFLSTDGGCHLRVGGDVSGLQPGVVRPVASSTGT